MWFCTAIASLLLEQISQSQQEQTRWPQEGSPTGCSDGHADGQENLTVNGTWCPPG